MEIILLRRMASNSLLRAATGLLLRSKNRSGRRWRRRSRSPAACWRSPARVCPAPRTRGDLMIAFACGGRGPAGRKFLACRVSGVSLSRNPLHGRFACVDASQKMCGCPGEKHQQRSYSSPSFFFNSAFSLRRRSASIFFRRSFSASSASRSFSPSPVGVGFSAAMAGVSPPISEAKFFPRHYRVNEGMSNHAFNRP